MAERRRRKGSSSPRDYHPCADKTKGARSLSLSLWSQARLEPFERTEGIGRLALGE